MASKSRSTNQPMCYVVAYDIPDDRRRTKIHQILTGFGKWTQYSLFECFLSGEYLIDTEDSVRFYPLCANCVTKVETIGDPPPKEEILFVI